MAKQGSTVRIGADIRELRRGLRDAEQALKESSQEMKNGFDSAKSAIKKACAVIVGSVVGVGVASVRAGEQANQSLGAIASQTNQSAEEMKQLDKTVRDVALTTGRFTAQEMREGLSGIARSGQDAEFQTLMLEKGMRLADASGNSLGDSISKVDKLMVKFNTEIEDGAKWVNTLATAQQELGISNASMVEGLQGAAGIANAASLEYDFLSASLSIAYQNGMSMATASTGLTGVFNQMLDPTSKIRDGMAQLGTEIIKNDDGTTNAQASFLKFIDELKAADPVVQENINNIMSLSGSNLDLFTNLLQNQDALADLTDSFRYAQKAGDDYNRVTEMAEARTGGFTEAIGLARNILRELLYKINDIIGAQLYEWLTDATTGFQEFMASADGQELIESLAEAIMKVVAGLAGLVEALAPIVLRWLPPAIELMTNFLNFIGENEWVIWSFIGAMVAFKAIKIFGTIGTWITSIGKLIGAKAMLKGAMGKTAAASTAMVGAKGGAGLLGGAGKMLAALGPKGWAILAVVGGTVATIKAVRNQQKEFEETYDEMYETTGSKTAAMATTAALNMGRMSEDGQAMTKELMEENATLFEYMVNNGATESEAMATIVSQHFGDMKDEATSELEELESEQERLMIEMENTSCESARAIKQVQIDEIEEMKKESVNTLKQLERDYEYYGEALPEGMETGINRGKPSALTVIGDFARGVGNRFKNFFGINSPSRLMRGYGGNIVDGLNQGMGDGESSTTVAEKISAGISRIWNKMPASVTRTGRNITNGLRSGMSEVRSRINDVATTIRDGIRSRWDNLGADGERNGAAAGNGLRRGLSNARRSIMDTAKGIANSVSSTMKKALDINSPSRVLMDIGADTGKGFALGIEGVTKQVEAVSRSLSHVAINGFEMPQTRYSLDDGVRVQETSSNEKEEQQPPIFIMEGQVVAKLLNPYSEDISRTKLNMVARGLVL